MNKMKIFTLFLTCIVLFVSLFSCQQAPPNGDGSDTTESNGEATLPDDSASDTEGTVEGGCQGLPRYFDLCWDAPMEGLLNFLSISYEVQQVEFMNIPLLCTWVQEIRQKNSVILPYVNGELIEPEGADITTEYGEFVTNRFSFKKNGKEFILKIQYTPQGYDPAQLFEGQDYRRITLADRVVHAYSPPHNHKIIQFMYDDLWVYMHMDTLELDTEWFATLSFEETPLLEEVPSTTVETKDGDAAIYLRFVCRW